MWNYFLPFLASLGISLLATPIVRQVAIKVGAVDIPKDERRVHKEGIPFLGGLAIYLGVIISIFIFLPIRDSKALMSILVGATIMMLTGLVDDFVDLSAKFKLIVQILAAGILVAGGVKIGFITNPFTDVANLIDLGMFSIPITIFWVVGITNTINFIDGIDGLSAGVAAISSLSLMLVAYRLGSTNTAILSGILAGGCLGFLPYNFNPAKIFMGDAGALFLGFMLAAISVEGVMKSAATIAIVVPVIILGIPVFDTTFAIFRRLAKGQNPMKADKGHLHHRLLDKGFSQKKTVLILYAVSLFFGLFAVGIVKINSRQSVYLSIALFLAAIIFAILISRREKNRSSKKN